MQYSIIDKHQCIRVNFQIKLNQKYRELPEIYHLKIVLFETPHKQFWNCYFFSYTLLTGHLLPGCSERNVFPMKVGLESEEVLWEIF